MKALVLAAGKGTRLGAAAGGVPKPLTDVGGTTPLEHALEWLTRLRLERIWINVHAHGELVRERIGAAVAGVPVSYSHEPVLLGTAGAWKKLEREWVDTSLIVYGDNVLRFDVEALLATHGRSGAVMTLALFDAKRTVHSGAAGGRARVERGRVVEFEEGGGEGMINAGVYCVEPALRERLTPGIGDFGHDVLPGLAAEGVLAAHVLEEGSWCLGVDTPERLEHTRAVLRSAVEVAS
ncbi:MAG TPA: sugar phosphate nucleotidyltransferase [Longimicrobiales bacterium]